MSVRRRLLWACRLGLAVWLVVVLVALHAPTPSAVPASRGLWEGAGALLPEAPDALRGLVGDKTLHVALFAPLGALWLGCRRLARRPAVWVGPGLLALAISSELLQQLGGRIADPWDIVADLVGSLLGAAAVQAVVLARRSARWRWQRPGGREAPAAEQARSEQQP